MVDGPTFKVYFQCAAAPFNLDFRHDVVACCDGDLAYLVADSDVECIFNNQLGVVAVDAKFLSDRVAVPFGATTECSYGKNRENDKILFHLLFTPVVYRWAIGF